MLMMQNLIEGTVTRTLLPVLVPCSDGAAGDDQKTAVTWVDGHSVVKIEGGTGSLKVCITVCTGSERLKSAMEKIL